LRTCIIRQSKRKRVLRIIGPVYHLKMLQWSVRILKGHKQSEVIKDSIKHFWDQEEAQQVCQDQEEVTTEELKEKLEHKKMGKETLGENYDSK
jgi:hypothetical protein